MDGRHVSQWCRFYFQGCDRLDGAGKVIIGPEGLACLGQKMRREAYNGKTRFLGMRTLEIFFEKVDIVKRGLNAPILAISQANRPSPAPGTRTLSRLLGTHEGISYRN